MKEEESLLHSGHSVKKWKGDRQIIVMKLLDKTIANPTLENPIDIDSVGPAEVTLISAALEFARRRG